MGNAVLQELLGDLSKDLNTLADLATAGALIAAFGSYRLTVKQMRNDSYIKASEWSIDFSDTFRAEVLPRMKLFSFVSSEVPIYAQAVMSLSVHSLKSFSEKEFISIAGMSSSNVNKVCYLTWQTVKILKRLPVSMLSSQNCIQAFLRLSIEPALMAKPLHRYLIKRLRSYRIIWNSCH